MGKESASCLRQFSFDELLFASHSHRNAAVTVLLHISFHLFICMCSHRLASFCAHPSTQSCCFTKCRRYNPKGLCRFSCNFSRSFRCPRFPWCWSLRAWEESSILPSGWQLREGRHLLSKQASMTLSKYTPLKESLTIDLNLFRYPRAKSTMADSSTTLSTKVFNTELELRLASSFSMTSSPEEIFQTTGHRNQGTMFLISISEYWTGRLKSTHSPAHFFLTKDIDHEIFYQKAVCRWNSQAVCSYYLLMQSSALTHSLFVYWNRCQNPS